MARPLPPLPGTTDKPCCPAVWRGGAGSAPRRGTGLRGGSSPTAAGPCVHLGAAGHRWGSRGRTTRLLYWCGGAPSAQAALCLDSLCAPGSLNPLLPFSVFLLLLLLHGRLHEITVDAVGEPCRVHDALCERTIPAGQGRLPPLRWVRRLAAAGQPGVRTPVRHHAMLLPCGLPHSLSAAWFQSPCAIIPFTWPAVVPFPPCPSLPPPSLPSLPIQPVPLQWHFPAGCRLL